jgi:hypothetical protein
VREDWRGMPSKLQVVIREGERGLPSRREGEVESERERCASGQGILQRGGDRAWCGRNSDVHRSRFLLAAEVISFEVLESWGVCG